MQEKVHQDDDFRLTSFYIQSTSLKYKDKVKFQEVSKTRIEINSQASPIVF